MRIDPTEFDDDEIDEYVPRDDGPLVSVGLVDHTAKVELMRYRYENGLDLWTGEPLDDSILAQIRNEK